MGNPRNGPNKARFRTLNTAELRKIMRNKELPRAMRTAAYSLWVERKRR